MNIGNPKLKPAPDEMAEIAAKINEQYNSL
jgi:hypothetical protein